MRCKKCNTKLSPHDLWCVNCGNQTEVVSNELSSIRSLRSTWKSFLPHSSSSVPASSFIFILGLLPTILVLWLLSSIISIDSLRIGFLGSILVKSTSAGIFLAFVFLSFNLVSQRNDYVFDLSGLRASLVKYPSYLFFSVVNAIYLVLISLVCFGLPSFGSDPILRLVWIVLVNYWVAIVLPVPVLMEKKHVSALKAILISYRHFHDVRWNIYLLAIVLFMINLLAFVLFVVPLVFTIPLSVYVIRDYTSKLIEFELLDYSL